MVTKVEDPTSASVSVPSKPTEDPATAKPAAHAKSAEPTVTATVTPLVDPAIRTARLDSLCTNHVLAALGVGLVPVPIIDILGVTAVQIDLITKLSAEYSPTRPAVWDRLK